MPSYSRSPGLLLEKHDSSIGVFSRSWSNQWIKDDGLREAKRRKTGLNLRFDRMVETMQVMHGGALNDNHKRVRKDRSSSISSLSNPLKTPVHTYARSHEGQLGRSSTGTRSRIYHVEDGTNEDGEDYNVQKKLSDGSSCPPKSLPNWLANTFSTLSPHHPLRMLLPSSPIPDHAENISQPQSADDGVEDMVFSFNAPPLDSSRMLANVESSGALHEEMDVDDIPASLAASSPHPIALSLNKNKQQAFPTVQRSIEISPFFSRFPQQIPVTLAEPAHDEHINGKHMLDQTVVTTVLPAIPLPFSTPGPGITPLTSLTHAPRALFSPAATGNAVESTLVKSTNACNVTPALLRSRRPTDHASGFQGSFTPESTRTSSSFGATTFPAYALPPHESPVGRSETLPITYHSRLHSGSRQHNTSAALDNGYIFDSSGRSAEASCSILARDFPPPYHSPAQANGVHPEDPSNSDPIDPADYMLDCDRIDFQWTPFNRDHIQVVPALSADSRHKHVLSNTRPGCGEPPRTPERPCTAEEPYAPAAMPEPHTPVNTQYLGFCRTPSSVVSRCSSSSIYIPKNQPAAVTLNFHPVAFDVSDRETRHSQAEPASPADKMTRTVFAPCPEIYISPLRESGSDSSLPASSEAKSSSTSDRDAVKKMESTDKSRFVNVQPTKENSTQTTTAVKQATWVGSKNNTACDDCLSRRLPTVVAQPAGVPQQDRAPSDYNSCSSQDSHETIESWGS
ncbi:hypothetical protein FISHEDRAFT_69249 [Fistulina hepatica ATCC 64428]|uniref:Uncharacterized protein n=1 Tax=Fistulina hepatica ATCC 64428 TaxID=1128425 RepID=A0A0D7AMX8_9AGAR|nr:hypothetical protein FISHEDRAFT_69249 [Fistulina hepatica ATCC 64428]